MHSVHLKDQKKVTETVAYKTHAYNWFSFNHAPLQINHKSFNSNILSNPLEGIEIPVSVELQALWSLLRNSSLSHGAWLQQQFTAHSPFYLCLYKIILWLLRLHNDA